MVDRALFSMVDEAMCSMVDEAMFSIVDEAMFSMVERAIVIVWTWLIILPLLRPTPKGVSHRAKCGNYD